METASRDDLEVPCRFGLCTASLSMLCIHSKPPATLACSKHASSAFRSPSHPSWPCGTCRASHSFLCFGTQQHGQTSQLSAAGFHHCQNLNKGMERYMKATIPIPLANTQIGSSEPRCCPPLPLLSDEHACCEPACRVQVRRPIMELKRRVRRNCKAATTGLWRLTSPPTHGSHYTRQPMSDLTTQRAVICRGRLLR